MVNKAVKKRILNQVWNRTGVPRPSRWDFVVVVVGRGWGGRFWAFSVGALIFKGGQIKTHRSL